jgi:hypothetical protein
MTSRSLCNNELGEPRESPPKIPHLLTGIILVRPSLNKTPAFQKKKITTEYYLVAPQRDHDALPCLDRVTITAIAIAMQSRSHNMATFDNRSNVVYVEVTLVEGDGQYSALEHEALEKVRKLRAEQPDVSAIMYYGVLTIGQAEMEQWCMGARDHEHALGLVLDQASPRAGSSGSVVIAGPCHSEACACGGDLTPMEWRFVAREVNGAMN